VGRMNQLTPFLALAGLTAQSSFAFEFTSPGDHTWAGAFEQGFWTKEVAQVRAATVPHVVLRISTLRRWITSPVSGFISAAIR
jgi:hypothetical protein